MTPQSERFIPQIVLNPAFRATSNRDYRGQKLPSPFGAETKHWQEVKHARAWLLEIRWGGRIEQWNAERKQYEPLEEVESAK